MQQKVMKVFLSYRSGTQTKTVSCKFLSLFRRNINEIAKPCHCHDHWRPVIKEKACKADTKNTAATKVACYQSEGFIYVSEHILRFCISSAHFEQAAQSAKADQLY